MNTSDIVVGLDVGTSSIGWAVIQEDAEGNASALLATGVRIFGEPVNPKTREPLNQGRRAARSSAARAARATPQRKCGETLRSPSLRSIVQLSMS